MSKHENAGLWEPPEGWTHSTKRHATHDCGFSLFWPAEDAGGYRAQVEAHAAACPWPDQPELVETVSD